MPELEGDTDNSDLMRDYHSHLVRELGYSINGYERTRVFSKDESSYHEIGTTSGLGSRLDGRSVAMADFDNDGDLDLVVTNQAGPSVNYFENTLETNNSFLVVDLQGVHSRVSPIGAKVFVEACGKRQQRIVSVGDGFMTQQPSELWFGLGVCESVAQLDVLWPSGSSHRFTDIGVNVRVQVAEETGGIQVQKRY